MFETIVRYFDINKRPTEKASPAPSSGTSISAPNDSVPKHGDVLWNLAFYAAVVSGVIGKQIFDSVKAGGPVRLETLLISLIVSALVFPAVYKSLKLDPSEPNVSQFFFAFLNGFWWQTIIGGLAK